MVRLAIVALGLALAGCDAINSAKDTFKNATATAEDLEATTGVKPTRKVAPRIQTSGVGRSSREERIGR